MQGIFDLLGACLAIYTVYAAMTGSVFIRHRAWGRTVVRDDEPFNFWSSIVIYGALSTALIFLF